MLAIIQVRVIYLFVILVVGAAAGAGIQTLKQAEAAEGLNGAGGFYSYDHAPGGAIITQSLITTALNEDYSHFDPSGRPTLKSIVAGALERDRKQFKNTGLIGYVNRDSRVRSDEIVFLESIGFSAGEIEKLLAP